MMTKHYELINSNLLKENKIQLKFLAFHLAYSSYALKELNLALTQ
jgi:hypothetical protein